MYGATIGKTSILGFEASSNQACAIAQPIEEVLFNQYLYYYLISEIRNFIKLGKGGAQPNISQTILKNHPIPIPPWPEQQRIVDKIEELFSELDEGIKSLKTAQQQLKVYRQAVLKWAFEGKLTAQWREQQGKLESAETLLAQIKTEREQRYQKALEAWQAEVEVWDANGKIEKRPKKPKRIKDDEPLVDEDLADYSKLPESWQYVRVSQLGDVQLGRQRSPKNRSKEYPTKYIRAANITEQGLDLTDILDMEFMPHEKEVYELRRGDLVLSEASGSAHQVGKPAIWLNQIPSCCFQNTVIRLRPYIISSDYILLAFKNFYHNGIFARVASGVGINHLSANKFSAIPFPIAPLDEQQVIVEEIETIFSVCDRIEADITTNLKKAEALRQSILKRAFEGKLVPQDPDDEPASVLLERIRAEKAQQAAAAKAAKAAAKKANKKPSIQKSKASTKA